PEFRRDLIESLREPLETGEVCVARAHRKTLWSARVLLVAACNNCPCGWLGSNRRMCTCPEQRVTAYRNRLSGPILDRIDIHFNVAENSFEDLDIFATKAAPQSQHKIMKEL